MAWVIFDAQIKRQEDGNAIDLEVNTNLRVGLITSALAPLKATHDFWDDLSANEVSGTGYTAIGDGVGAVLNNPVMSLVAGTVKFDADDPATWSQNGAGFSNARYAVLVEPNAGATSTWKLIAYADLGSDVGNVAGDLTLQLDASNGVFTKTSS